MVSAMADGMSASHIVQSMIGQVRVGGPAGTSPSTSTPASTAGVMTTTIVATTSTTSAQGTTGSSRRPPTSTVTAQIEITSDHTLSVGRPVTRPTTLSTNSPPESIFTPSIFAICDTRM